MSGINIRLAIFSPPSLSNSLVHIGANLKVPPTSIVSEAKFTKEMNCGNCVSFEIKDTYVTSINIFVWYSCHDCFILKELYRTYNTYQRFRVLTFIAERLLAALLAS